MLNDLRGIVNNDAQLQEHLSEVLATYHTEHFHQIELPSPHQGKVLLTPYNQLDGGRFVAPSQGVSFEYDHIQGQIQDIQPIEEQDPKERHELQEQMDEYVSRHYSNGIVNVFVDGEGSKLVVCLVGDKYSGANYWNGSWRSMWSFAHGQLNGSCKVQVHYFEEGNVQLDTQSDFSKDIQLDKVVGEIERFEGEYQQAVNDGYGELAERTFKGLRRTLPVTQTRVDWEKISNYRIGNELAK